ncbi:unnamed protein product [Peronospora belbahrii]|uniref:Reverse transcriptase domain-containing protein n=1 Tax=Peronospora belbahrii TaxID=622444 RepID=A0AAU9KX50_9STRA|nr:unnamed protein product [Peronospora belbahrii]CAH0476224.1 unnamed protein product [Peronospora belbahrii]
MVLQSWKLGLVSLEHKKGARDDPANWRPICLQQTIYKLYTGVMARRLARWLDANDRHAPGQKGFRAVNGCEEHNFLAATLIDSARRKHCPLYEVWYDFRNAFGSVPLSLLWDVLARTGVPVEYITMCQGFHSIAAFVVGNAVDGSTALIQQRVGVFQGCPLIPHRFSAAISPLLHALDRLQTSGVQLSSNDRPRETAHADDLKIFPIRRMELWSSMDWCFVSYIGLAWRPTRQMSQYGLLKAVKVYLYPRVEHALRHLRPDDQHLERFDVHLCRLGLTTLVEYHAALQIAHEWQMPHSADPAVRRVCTPANTGSGTPTQLLQLRVPHHAGYLEHRNVLRQVRQHMKLLRWKAWCAHKDQGKTARAHGGLGSGFLTRPRGMWGSDYRFDIAARLDMLDTVMFSRVDASVLMLDAGTRAAGGKSRSPMFSTTARQPPQIMLSIAQPLCGSEILYEYGWPTRSVMRTRQQLACVQREHTKLILNRLKQELEHRRQKIEHRKQKLEYRKQKIEQREHNLGPWYLIINLHSNT